MVVNLSGGARPTVSIGGSSGIHSTAPVSSSYSSPSVSHSSPSVSYSSPSVSSVSVQSTPVVITPSASMQSAINASKASNAAIVAANTAKNVSNVTIVPSAIMQSSIDASKSSVDVIQAANSAANNVVSTVITPSVSMQSAINSSKAATAATVAANSAPQAATTMPIPQVVNVSESNAVSIGNSEKSESDQKLVIQSVNKESKILESTIPTLISNSKPISIKKNSNNNGDDTTTDDTATLASGNVISVSDIKKMANEIASILTQQNAKYNNLPQITSPYAPKTKISMPDQTYTSLIDPIVANMKIPTKVVNQESSQVLSTPTVSTPSAALSGHPAALAKPLQDLSGLGGEELVAPQPTSFEWSMPAGKVGPNYVDAQGNIMSKDAYVQKYNVDPDYALWYMRSGQAAKELATTTAVTGQKFAQLSTIVSPQQSVVQNPVSSDYQTWEHPASVAYPLVDNSVYGGEELVGPQPTSFEWTMPSGRIGPNYVDAQGNIMSKDVYIQKYNVDPEYALQYMRSNQAAKELDNTIAGRQYENLSTIAA